MKKTANIIYLVLGTIMPILIGALHTWVHFDTLTTSLFKKMLNHSVVITGETQIAYNTWGLMSFMMGFTFIIMGLLHFAFQKYRGWDKYPSLAGCVIILMYLLGVIYAGHNFSAMKQFYGSIIGLILLIICITITISGTKKELA